ncbi:MAG: serine hydrolase [Acidobacteria bacterium]|nr:serine hydrolase [Acidobacteriota bacterium]
MHRAAHGVVVSALFALELAEAVLSAQMAPWDPSAIQAEARRLPRLFSLLVSRGGRVIFEGYYHGARADRPANVKSVSKSVISTLVGIAIQQAAIPGTGTPIARYFPELAGDPDPRKRTISVEHLLTMRAGLAGTSGREYGAWVTSPNWVRYVLAQPAIEPPGTEMEYSTGNSHLLSAILTKTTGRSTWEYANQVLAGPLGFRLSQWTKDPQGIFFGGNEMAMTSRQMLALGELYLNHGRAGETPVVPASWVEQSCTGRPRNRRPGGTGASGFADPMRDRRYGYGWWVHVIGGYDTCFAWGYGGQYIFVIPALDTVIVATSSPEVGEERRGHRQGLFDILERLVVAPIARERGLEHQR